jgi:AraC-like DNA-binding protein
MTLIDDILEGLRLESSVFCRMTLSGDWGFAKDALSGAPFHLVLSGQAWLRTEAMDEALQLNAGDIVILPRGEEHSLLARADTVPIPFRDVADRMALPRWLPGKRFKTIDLPFGEGGPATILISGVFAFGDHRRNPLFSALPSMLLTRANSDAGAAGAVAAIATLLNAELLSGMPGAEIVAARLADILFIQVVRHHLASTETLPRGWLRGITDGEIAPALACIHREPEKAWSVATLARIAGMSRSRFAARFQGAVGQAPLEYLTHWRMYQAAGRLAEGRIALPALASSVGYRSEVSFGKAFKRWAGRSPGEYRRSLASEPASASSS